MVKKKVSPPSYLALLLRNHNVVGQVTARFQSSYQRVLADRYDAMAMRLINRIADEAVANGEKREQVLKRLSKLRAKISYRRRSLDWGTLRFLWESNPADDVSKLMLNYVIYIDRNHRFSPS